ncbi:hypothetical protein Tco_1543529 [Tanacetum coccineum]
MMAEIQDVHLFKRKSLRVPMFIMMLETFRELFEPRLQELLQMFSVTTAVRKVIMLVIVQSQEFGIQTIIQPANIDSDVGPSDDSAFLNDSNDDVNNSSVEDDNNAQQSYKLEQLARNAYKEAKKQQIVAKKVQQQNIVLTKHLELYKEKVRVFEITKGNNTNYFNEYVEADRKAKRFEQESQSQYIRDRETIRDLEQQRDKLDLSVVELKRQTLKLEKTQSILKRKMSENEDKYHDTFLDLEAKVKKNVDTMLKIGNSLQGIFMLRPKPMSYDSQSKHGLGYTNLYTLCNTPKNVSQRKYVRECYFIIHNARYKRRPLNVSFEK